MVRKQSATKSTGKHISDKSPRRSADSPLEIPFTINPNQPHFWSMKFFPERGYNMEKSHPSFKATVEALHWEKFVIHRTHYMEQLVREFYAGLITKSGDVLTDHSMVRGMKVKFDEETINKHFDLHYTGNSFDEKFKQYGKKQMEQIKNRVAVPYATWDKASHTEFKLKIRYIIPELGNWHMFINCSIMPTSHNYTLPKDRLIVLDCIMTDEEINIGRIINKEIQDCAKKTEGFIYFPCLITELCETQGVRISEAEKHQKKKPPSALSAELKTRRVFKDPEDLGKEKKVFEKKIKEEMKTEKDEKDSALKRYLLDKHEWIKSKFEEIFISTADMPEFPFRIFENVEAEVENESEKEEGIEEEVIKKKTTMKRKKPTKTKGKEKKKAGEVEWIEVESTEEEEDEDLKKMEKETDEEEDNTTTEGSEQTETDSDLDLSMEELVRKRRGKDPILEPIIPPHQSPAKQTSPTKQTTPPSTGTTPPPPDKINPPQADVLQKEGAEPSSEHSLEPTKEKSPPLDQPREKTPPLHDRSTILLPYIVSDTGSVQVTEDIPISAEGAETADIPVTAETGASAPGEPAPEKDPATTATVVEGNIEQTLNVVIAELAAKKRAELENTQKFFKKPTDAGTSDKSVGAGAPVTEPVKEVPTEQPKEKGATEEDATLKDVAETLKNLPAQALEQSTEPAKETAVQAGVHTPGEPAPEQSTPKASKATALQTGASGTKSTGKKDKKEKPKPTPTRSSSRLRSGAKP